MPAQGLERREGSAGGKKTFRFGTRVIEASNLDKVFYQFARDFYIFNSYTGNRKRRRRGAMYQHHRETACVEVRQQTSGAARWCPTHDRPWVPPHRYAYADGILHPYHSDGMG